MTFIVSIKYSQEISSLKLQRSVQYMLKNFNVVGDFSTQFCVANLGVDPLTLLPPELKFRVQVFTLYVRTFHQHRPAGDVAIAGEVDTRVYALLVVTGQCCFRGQSHQCIQVNEATGAFWE